MGGLCVLFLVMGIVSLKKSKVYETQAKAEGDRETKVITWFRENCPAEKINEILAEQLMGLSEEEAYFKRYSAIKQVLYNNFPDTGIEFQDHMADEVYEALFGDE